jgi:hypothetical protein
MIFTAIVPVAGGSKGRLRVRYSDAHASSSISALSAWRRRLYGSLAPVKYASRTKKLSPL